MIEFIGNAVGEASRSDNGKREWIFVAILVLVGIVILGVLALVAI